MSEVLSKITSAFMAQSWLEVVAVICAVLYLVLVVRENIWCWFFAFVSTALFIFLFHEGALFSESLLNVYYLVMALYGWRQWVNKAGKKEIEIHHWSNKSHLLIAVGTVVLTPVVGYLMASIGAAFPYLDAFVAILSVIATVMVTNKVFENWYYWLLIDSLSIYIFWQKQYYFVAALYVAYIVLIFIGIKAWKKTMILQKQGAN
jgi:nicotinamide mononucleotide transporter